MHIKLENKQVAVFATLIIAVIMLFLPGQNAGRFSFDPDALASAITKGEDQVAPKELAQRIIEGRNDFSLIDIRPQEDYAKGHILGAKNIPLAELVRRDTVESAFLDGKTPVLYSNGNTHAAQAWLILNAAGIDALVLEGGYNNWMETVRNPQAPAAGAADDEILRYSADRAVAEYFGGGSPGKEQGASAQPGSSGAPKVPVFKPGKKNKLKGC